MQESILVKETFPIFQGGGEMGELTRNYDWSSTAIGSPDQWPQPLRVTVANLLRSRFPMFLWWGKQMIQFYNDAYRPSLGNEGKHPTALGQSGRDCWPEIWDIVFPLIQQVETTGEATWREDQLVPIFRNGKIEDVYWTYSYSSVLDDEGKHGGILVTCVETTSQVKARKTLDRSENNLRNMILQAPVAMCILRGPSFIVEIANDRMYEVWGKSAAEMAGKPIFEALPEAKNQGFEQLLHNVFTTGETFTAYGLQTMLPRNGKMETVYLNFVYEAYKESNGTISGVMAVASEVTEQVIAAKRNAASEQQVRRLVESAPFPIGVYVGKEMRIAFVNKSILDAWGRTEEVIGKTYAEVLPELENQYIFEQLDNVYTTGVPFHARNQRVDLNINGVMRPHYFNYSFTPVFDAEGNVYGVMNTAADVTDLNIAKQKVEQSEENFRNMVLQAPVAMCILMGPTHIVEIANEDMIELWGKKTADVMNKPIFDALPDAREQGLEVLMSRVYETGETFQAEEHPVNLLRNGKMETVYQNFVYEPYKDATGNILGVLAISVDVTSQVMARRKIEEIVAERTGELEQANKTLVLTNMELGRSNANLEQFAYAASHDLKEPVRKMHFYANRIKTTIGNKFSEQEFTYFTKMEEASNRMAKLIDDLLEYSQVSILPHQTEQVDLNKLIEVVLHDLELEIEQKNAKIKKDSLFTIEGNPRQLQQAFQNLIGNALKYHKPDMAPEIDVSCHKLKGSTIGLLLSRDDQQKEFYAVFIADKGIGFDQRDAENIFNVFTRLESENTVKGTGIGLSIVRKVIENHNGYVTAESKKGEGSVFKVFLPV